MAISNRTFQGRTRFVGNVYTKQIASPESDGNGILIELGKTTDNSDLVNFTVDPKNLTVQGKPLVHLDENNKIPESLLPSISVVDIYIEPSRESFFRMSSDAVRAKYGNLPERGDMLIVSEEPQEENNGIWLMTGQTSWNQIDGWIQIQVGVTPKSILNNTTVIYNNTSGGTIESATTIVYPTVKNNDINYFYQIKNEVTPKGTWSDGNSRKGTAYFELSGSPNQKSLSTVKPQIRLGSEIDYGSAEFGIYAGNHTALGNALVFKESSRGEVLNNPTGNKFINHNGNLIEIIYKTFTTKSTFTYDFLQANTDTQTVKGPVKISINDSLGNACDFYTSVYYDTSLGHYYFSEVIEEIIGGYGAWELGLSTSAPGKLSFLMNDYMVIPSNTTVEATIKIEYLNGSMLK